MKLLYYNVKNKIEYFDNYVEQSVISDYIYDYPPRQAYRLFQNNIPVVEIIKKSLIQSDDINLYFHFPFCKQICSYCNLFSICETKQSAFEEYFKALKKEIEFYLPYIKGKKVKTIYLGGGTPSLINPNLMGDFLNFLEENIGFKISEISEVAMEISPDTATKDNLSKLIEIGVNRINIGVQSVNNEELSSIGRKYASNTIDSALSNAMNAGFSNVCVDLIYGLESQTYDMWIQSVKEIVLYEPQTICAYPLTLRKNTFFSNKGYCNINGHEQYEKYKFVKDYLTFHGYEQETHVRFKKIGSKGGYIQKENHWNQQNILGFGAGARSYLKEINTRNGYSILNRRKIYNDYLFAIKEKSFSVVDGFIMDKEEKIRKHVVLGLDGLNLNDFEKLYGVSFYSKFPIESEHLIKFGYLEEKNGCVFLTNKGTQYRDLIVQLFFSEKVNKLIGEYNYDE